MSTPEQLLEELKEEFGVNNVEPHGESLLIPNNELKPEWTSILGAGGYKMFAADRYGRISWVIPIKKRRVEPIDPPLPGGNVEPQRKGEPWSKEEDALLLKLLDQGKTNVEVGQAAASQISRSARSLRDRVAFLRRQQSPPAQIKPEEPDTRNIKNDSTCVPEVKVDPPTSEPRKDGELKSLLQSALVLSGDSEHKIAVRVLLEACLSRV